MRHVPNILTLSRIFVIPVLVGTFFMPFPWSHWIAFVLFALASITDYFDGLIARTYELTSKLGQFLDPIADKLMVATVLLMLTAIGTVSGIHILAGLVILLREILVSGLREFLSGMEVSVPVTWLAKWKTGFQMTALSGLLLGEAAPPWLPAVDIGLGLLWLAAVFTLYTGFDYLKAGLKHF